MAWAAFIALYSLAGGIFLLIRGQFFFFYVYPEWSIYGGIGIGVAVLAIINIFALSNSSFVWARVCKFLWPFVIVISAIRAIIMLVELNRGKDGIIWECQNGGQLWPSSVDASQTATNGTVVTFPLVDSICAPGFSSLYTAFTISLLVDIGCQMYMLFLNWRFSKRLEHYSSVKGFAEEDL